MTVYVDDMYRHSIGQFRGMSMSHMIADTEEELHAMADTIGVQRRWYQGDHYDIAYGKRHLAIKAGAVQIDYRSCGLMVHLRKCGWPLIPPPHTRGIFAIQAALDDITEPPF